MPNINRRVAWLVPLFLWGCQLMPSNDPSSSDDTTDTTTPHFSYRLAFAHTDTIPYHQVITYQTQHDSIDYEQADIAKIVLTYPIMDSSIMVAAADSINQKIEYVLLKKQDGDLAFQSINQRVRGFIKDFEEYDQEMREFGLMTGPKWFNTVSIQTQLNSTNLYSFSVIESEFMGGAHANQSTRYYNINTKTGQEIQLHQIYDSTATNHIQKAAVVAFKKKVAIPLDSNLITSSFGIEETAFPFPQNFCIQSTGILFYYNPYDLDNLILQQMTFLLPYDSIHQWINPAIIPLDSFPIIAIDTTTL